MIVGEDPGADERGRIEDNLLITATGSENLTPTIKDPDELEKFISSS